MGINFWLQGTNGWDRPDRFFRRIFPGYLRGKFVGLSQTIYGLALVLLIIFLPKGIYGTLSDLFKKKTF